MLVFANVGPPYLNGVPPSVVLPPLSLSSSSRIFVASPPPPPSRRRQRGRSGSTSSRSASVSRKASLVGVGVGGAMSPLSLSNDDGHSPRTSMPPSPRRMRQVRYFALHGIFAMLFVSMQVCAMYNRSLCYSRTARVSLLFVVTTVRI